MSTTYPGITASPGEYLTFPLQIHNRGGASRVVQLRVDRCPEEWQASLMAQGRHISEVFVEGNSAERAELKIRVPENAAEEIYSVTVAAAAGGSVCTVCRLKSISAAPAPATTALKPSAELQGRPAPLSV